MMTKSRFLLSLGLLLAVSAQAKPAGLKVIYDVTVAGGKEPVRMESTYLIQDKAVRFETSGPSLPTGKTVMIAKPEAKKYILLMEAQKMYMEMPEPNEKDLAEATAKQVPFQSTGKTKTIAGYSCEVAERTIEGRREEACAAKDLGDAFAELEKSMPKRKGDASGLPGGLKGFPLEYIVKTGSSGDAAEYQMKVREVKRENLAKALFEIPKGYTKQEIPAFGAPPKDWSKLRGKLK